MTKHIGAWEIYTGNLSNILQNAVDSGEISESDIVWGGPDGSVAVSASAYDIEDEYSEYVDEGQVSEYL